MRHDTLRSLYLTAELPYFPGQGGLMPLLVRELRRHGPVGVVGPRYEHQPAGALERLRAELTASYFWPEPAATGELPATTELPRAVAPWLLRFPARWRRALLDRLLDLHRHPPEAVEWLAVFNNLAPHVLAALRSPHRWHAVLLAQSSSSVWLKRLPATVATGVYFHDIRSDYLARARSAAGDANPGRRRRRAEERDLVRRADAVAFVSELDADRAKRLLEPTCETAVVPVCVDAAYFGAVAKPRTASAAPVVLFTGHLAHPPNVDAALYFLREIWPQVRAQRPDAICRIVGLLPAAEVRAAVEATAGAELKANVPEIRDEFAAASVFVVPMRYGGGVRQKILEAWAAGVPVVTTTMGAEGLAAEHGKNCWIHDDPAAFASAVLRTLGTTPDAALVQHARETVARDHAPELSGERVRKLLSSAVAKRRTQPAKVLIDLRWMEIGRAGGLEQMSYELVAALAAHDRRNEYRLLGPRRTLLEWDFPRDFRVKLHDSDAPAPRWPALRERLVEGLASSLGLPPLRGPALAALERYGQLDFTVVHSLPCYTHPDLLGFPSVLTVHDLQHLHLPEFFSAADIATRERHYRESCAAASRIICISEFTRQDVHQRYGVPLDRLVTIWNLPPQLAARPASPAADRRRLQAMGITTPYVFFPAHGWRHKNHARLLEAFELAAPRLPAGLRLVLTGGAWEPNHPAAARLAELTARGRAIHLGFRTPLETAALYRGAEALVFPSLFEGFGMPVVEAMSAGVPVACSRTTSLPEIAGDAACYFDPLQPADIAESIVRVAADATLREQLRAAGRQRVRVFDPAETARRTTAVYREVHEAHFS